MTVQIPRDQLFLNLLRIKIREISEAKHAEEELKKSEAEFRKLFQNSPLPNIIYYKDALEILDVDHAALDHYDYTHTDFLQLTLLNCLPEEEIFNFKKNFSNLPEKVIKDLLESQRY